MLFKIPFVSILLKFQGKLFLLDLLLTKLKAFIYFHWPRYIIWQHMPNPMQVGVVNYPDYDILAVKVKVWDRGLITLCTKGVVLSLTCDTFVYNSAIGSELDPCFSQTLPVYFEKLPKSSFQPKNMFIGTVFIKDCNISSRQEHNQFHATAHSGPTIR